ncbi:glycosyltransferase family 10 domain-containing protein [Pedobacter sp. AW1-32]|uniref:glycosyltransferase family 10 domain-containing protein n=1 Tax=Pedobacter sp. AW1-32 TaxID=3383026 RepID=UPI003FF0F228
MVKRNKIKINFTDFWEGFDPADSFFYQLLAKHFDVEISEKPDILFYSVYTDVHRRYSCTKILYTGENVRPNFSDCDYAFSFDFSTNSKNYRLPLYALYYNVNNLINKKIDTKKTLETKKKFCCFIVSNPICEIRNNFFKLLSSYQKVDSGGKLYNNIGYCVENKLEFIRDYKFVIAFENSAFDGYVTEKIYEPFFANSVPIYWGSETVSKDFNTKRFINCHDYPDFEAVIERILFLDRNDEEYLKILSEPVFTNDQLTEFVKEENILNKLTEIIAYTQNKTILQKIRDKTRFLRYRCTDLIMKIQSKLKIRTNHA